MILAAGLTPAWQQVLVFDSLTLGEVNRAAETHWFASGKVINTARALWNLGAESKALSFVGGMSGDHIAAEFASDGISAHWVQTSTATRVCTTILQRDGAPTTELVENAAPVTKEEVERFRSAYLEEVHAAKTVVFTGSLPQGVSQEFYAELLRETTAPAILDIRGPELLAVLSRKPLCVKPNRHELELTVGHDCSEERTLIEAARQLCGRGALWVLVTDGPHTTWLVSLAEAFKLSPPAVEVVNPIGAGDCLTATLAWATDRGDAMVDATRLAMAAASEDVTLLLPARFDPGRIAARAEEVVVERYDA